MRGSYARHDMGVKANFDHIYDREDPRDYYAVLSGLGYQAPDHGSRLFSGFLEAASGNGSAAKVVDLCCSYGVNAALLKHELGLNDLYARYGSQELEELSADELADNDATFYEDHTVDSPPEVVGVDIAGNAVSYALKAGLLDEGFATNLEEDEPAEDFKEAVSGADLISVTGGIGYVWCDTFDRVLSCFEKEDVPWVATLPLRMVDYAPIAGVMADHGLVTEKLPARTFPQRRFTDDREQQHVLRELKAAGIDTAGKEETGWYHSELYLSRPAGEAAELPLQKLPGISSAL